MAARILVIEDNPANLELMTYLLKAFGHTVLSARDGEEGIDVALREIPDLILCDLALPKVDGYEVVTRVRTEGRLQQSPIIAVTASAMVGDRDKVIAKGFDGYISKPITPETFVAEVEAYLHRTEECGDHPGR
jgi:CheY-like chemotaxis protein